MANAGQLAALIAAVFWALLVCAGIVVLIRLARLLSAAARLLSEFSGRADHLLEQAHSAIDRTNQQLAKTDAITASMDEVTANMAELTEHVSALAALSRAILGAPLGKAAAFAYGVRRAVALRRGGTGRGAAGRAGVVRVPEAKRLPEGTSR
jgi:uncharacterized protein YoxC